MQLWWQPGCSGASAVRARLLVRSVLRDIHHESSQVVRRETIAPGTGNTVQNKAGLPCGCLVAANRPPPCQAGRQAAGEGPHAVGHLLVLARAPAGPGSSRLICIRQWQEGWSRRTKGKRPKQVASWQTKLPPWPKWSQWLQEAKVRVPAVISTSRTPATRQRPRVVMHHGATRQWPYLVQAPGPPPSQNIAPVSIPPAQQPGTPRASSVCGTRCDHEMVMDGEGLGCSRAARGYVA